MSRVWKEVKEARGRERTLRGDGDFGKGAEGGSEERKGREGESASEERREYWDSEILGQGVKERWGWGVGKREG